MNTLLPLLLLLLFASSVIGQGCCPDQKSQDNCLAQLDTLTNFGIGSRDAWEAHSQHVTLASHLYYNSASGGLADPSIFQFFPIILLFDYAGWVTFAGLTFNTTTNQTQPNPTGRTVRNLHPWVIGCGNEVAWGMTSQYCWNDNVALNRTHDMCNCRDVMGKSYFNKKNKIVKAEAVSNDDDEDPEDAVYICGEPGGPFQ